MTARWMEQLAGGEPISKAARFEYRRNQVRAVQRVLAGVDKLFTRRIRRDWTTRPLERHWRDLRTAGTHRQHRRSDLRCLGERRVRDGAPSFVMH